jgi:hypothetical protein
MERGPTGAQHDLDRPIWSKVFKKQDVQGGTSIGEDLVELDTLDNGANYARTLPRLWHKVQVVTVVEGDGDLIPLKVHGGGGWGCHDLPGCEFLLSPWLIRIGATIDIVGLLVSFGEVAFVFLMLFLLIAPFGHLEHFICETLE